MKELISVWGDLSVFLITVAKY